MRTPDQLDPAEVLDQLPVAFDDDRAAFERALAHRKSPQRHGDLPGWRRAIDALPPPATAATLDTAAPCAELPPGTDPERLQQALRALSPWRKGPWRFGPIEIDAEWRSDLKWQRIADAVQPLDGRRVLDVGGGNGYFAFRLVGAGAAAVLNVDPTLLFYQQFLAVRHLLADRRVGMLPVPLEALEPHSAYDTVISMGVLYHRRSPIHHLRRLAAHLAPGGQLLLETLVVEGGQQAVLVPERRYARMRNVWFVPSIGLLNRWLSRTGFEDVRTVDVTPTTTDEQRRTDWMHFESLADALQPDDPTRTIEGLPAPVRAVVSARRAR